MGHKKNNTDRLLSARKVKALSFLLIVVTSLAACDVSDEEAVKRECQER
jgi:hypothetical protein